MGKRLEQVHQMTNVSTNGQWSHEKVINIISHEGNVN